MKMDASAFQDTTVGWEGTHRPMRASRLTRAIYCLALLAFALPALGQGASWVGMATGGAFSPSLATWVFFVITAMMAVRIYRVASYHDALDARPPYPLGWLLRWLGWLVMLAGIAGLAAMFMVEPLTLLLFNGAGEDGVGFFMVGFCATVLASTGWVGCLLFELSRWVGHPLTEPGSTERQRLERIG